MFYFLSYFPIYFKTLCFHIDFEILYFLIIFQIVLWNNQFVLYSIKLVVVKLEQAFNPEKCHSCTYICIIHLCKYIGNYFVFEIAQLYLMYKVRKLYICTYIMMTERFQFFLKNINCLKNTAHWKFLIFSVDRHYTLHCLHIHIYI